MRQDKCHQLDPSVRGRCPDFAPGTEQTGQRQEKYGGKRRRQQAAVKAPCIECHLIAQFHALMDEKFASSVPIFCGTHA